jgi:ABC-2 type transport system permease protein
MWFPWKGLFVSWPGMVFNVMPAAEGLKLYACSHLFLTLDATTILGLAFMFSCFNMKPAAATILALSFLFLNLVMENIPFFEQYHEWFLPYHFRIWLFTYAQPTPWPRIVESLWVLAAFNITVFLVGTAVFQVRDIKS